MSTTSNSPSKPSRKMLGYLRYLAEQTGTSFTYPHTAAEAHREIERLLSLKRESKAEIKREQRAVQDDMATRRGDAAAVRSDELVGYGSNCQWSHLMRS